MRQITYIISGRVQGVGFRYGVYKFVRSNLPTLIGFVENLPDNKVRVVIEDTTIDHQEILEKYLRKGPLLAKVTNIEKKHNQESENLYLNSGFEIRR